MKDLMIDLETLSTSPNAVVLSIGACFFDIETGEIGEKFYKVLDVEQQLDRGRVIDSSTLSWWMNQSKEAKSVFLQKSENVDAALKEFCRWATVTSNFQDMYVWGNGSTFDVTIMETLMKVSNVPLPWKFFNVMDLRTFRRFVANNQKVKKIGTNHNALDDAMSQAQFVCEIMGSVKDEEEAG